MYSCAVRILFTPSSINVLKDSIFLLHKSTVPWRHSVNTSKYLLRKAGNYYLAKVYPDKTLSDSLRASAGQGLVWHRQCEEWPQAEA